MEETLASQLALAYITSHGLEWLKNSPLFPLMQKDAKWLNRGFSAFMAFVVSVGIHVAHTWTVNADGSHLIQLTIHIPMFSILIEHIWDWALQYAFQDGAFRALVKK